MPLIDPVEYSVERGKYKTIFERNGGTLE